MEDDRKFGGFLSDICGDILFKKVRAEVEDELYDHLMCQYEKNLACGMTEEEAEKQAKKDLGSTNELKQKLSAVHSYFPSLSAKKALDMMIAGFLIYFIGGDYYFLAVFGLLFVLCSAFCLRTANKTLKIGFAFSVLHFATVIGAISFENWFYLNQPLSICITVLHAVLYLLMMFFISRGITELVKPYINEFTKPIRFGFPLILIAVLCIVGLFLAIETRSVFGTIPNGISLSISGVVIAIFFCTALGRASKLLYSRDIEYNIETSPIKKGLVIACAFIVAVSCFAVGSFNFGKESTQGVESVIDDVQMSDKEYDRICGNLLSYGVPKNVVENLPKSEIARFKGSMNYNEMTPSAKKLYDSEKKYYEENAPDRYTEHEKNGFNYDFSVWLIGMNNEDREHKDIRAIYYFKYPEKMKHKFNDILFFNTLTYNNYSSDILNIVFNDSEYVKLFDDSGKEFKPFSTYLSSDLVPNYVTMNIRQAIEFQARENLNIYYAVTYSDSLTEGETVIPNDYSIYSPSKRSQPYSLYHKEFPVTPFRSVRSISDRTMENTNGEFFYSSRNTLGYTDYAYCPVIWFVVHPDLIYKD